MATHVVLIESSVGSIPAPRRLITYEHIARYFVPIGRIFFSGIFLTALFGNFSDGAIARAQQHGVPFASFLVPASGVLAFVGALSISTGYHARIGAWMIVAFLVPVTLMMHNFWAIGDPQAAQLQQAMFMKNLSLIGAALFMAYYGSGPFSVDAMLSTPRPTRELDER